MYSICIFYYNYIQSKIQKFIFLNRTSSSYHPTPTSTCMSGCIRIRSGSSPIIIGSIVNIFIGHNSSNFVINTLLPFWACWFRNCNCCTRFESTFLTSYANCSTSCRDTCYKTGLIYFSYSCIT